MFSGRRQVGRDHRVAVLRCEDYVEVKPAIVRGLDLLGGVFAFAAARDSLLLKPNLLLGDRPDRGSTTNPAVFRAAAELLQATGATLVYGDSPGFGSPAGAVRASGLRDIADELGMTLADFVNAVETPNPNGKLEKMFRLAVGLKSADGVINLPKFKTHGVTRLTGAVKNLFGCLPGVQKSGFHTRLQDETRFSQMLVDLAELVSPRLHILDGVVGMEGNGPRNGTLRTVGVVMISTNPYALDHCIARIMDLDPDLVPTLRVAMERGLYDPAQIEILGDPLAAFILPDFKVNRSKTSPTGGTGFWKNLVKNAITPHPVIDPEKCTRCGRCVRICPATPKAVGFDDGDDQPPSYTYRDCIRCYCCQEMCPEEAISIEIPLLGQVLDQVRG
ncbi:DUF362 domain-containing protein [bacterium]|nr:DUF362 domain-containing protein [bacterium]